MNEIYSKRLWIWMDVSATCNLACRDCYTKHTHAPTLLSADRFKIILEKLAAAPYRIEKLHLNWRGEPLTNKHLPKLLEIRRDLLPNVTLELHTNGLLLNPTVCRDIVERTFPNDIFYVSIDGGRLRAHEANRGANTWTRTLNGLESFLDARDSSFTRGPNIGIYEISYERARPYDVRLRELARRCDIWTRVNAIRVNGEEASFDCSTVPKGPCFWAGNSLCITAEGAAHICLLSFNRDGLLGNLLTESVSDIVARAESFRDTLAAHGRQFVTHCSQCKKTEGALDDP